MAINKDFFGLWSYNKNNFSDMAFSCFAQATEGDFTIGKENLDIIAEALAYNWIHLQIIPNTEAAKNACKELGFDYNDLLDEEIDYLKEKIEKELNKHG